MLREVTFALEEANLSWIDNYDENKFAVAKTCFLSTRPNSHELDIDKETLEKYASTILGNFLVAKLENGDSTTHLPDEVIYGYYPKDQEIEFVDVEEDGETVTKAYAYAVISKLYGGNFIKIFENNNFRSTSVEMKVETPEDDEHKVVSFDIYGLTCLGTLVQPSCPDADMKMVRFSADEAEEYFKTSEATFTALKKFAEDRKKMEEAKTYKIDKSKESVSNDAWGNVDKASMRNKIIAAKNKSTLVKSVYLLVEDGWEEAPSEHLKYPVMQLKGDTFVYNSNALSSALGYAKKENETAVVSKVEKIQKKLGLGDSAGDNEPKEGKAKMSKEIEFAAVDIGDMWGKVYDALHAKYPDGDWGSVYRIDGIYEEDNQKFAIIHHRDDDTRYRLDFSLTEEGLTLADEIVKVELEIVETDEIKKFAEPEDAKKYKEFEGKDGGIEMTVEELQAKCEKLEHDCEEKENIIMDKDAKLAEYEEELAELREFKAAVEKKELAAKVEATMAEVEECMSKEDCEKFRAEGMECDMASFDAWANKVKASCFEAVKKGAGKKDAMFSFSAPMNNNTEPKDIWDKL